VNVDTVVVCLKSSRRILDFSASEVAALISDYHLNYPDKRAFRSGVKSFWAAKYNAAVNYPEFIERCLQGRDPDQSGT